MYFICYYALHINVKEKKDVEIFQCKFQSESNCNFLSLLPLFTFHIGNMLHFI